MSSIQLDRLKIIFSEKSFISPCDFNDYVTTNSKIKFICKNGHKHSSKAKNFLYGFTGCKLCANDKRKKVLDLDLVDRELKECGCCREIKNKSNFGKDCSKKDNLKDSCKLCRRKQELAIKNNGGDFYKQKRNKASKKFFKKNPFKVILSRCKQNHKKKSFIEEFNIDEDYLKKIFDEQNGLCYWSKIPISIDNVGLSELDSLSVDRLNCNLGYIIGDIVLTIKFVNLGRGNVSEDYFRNFIKNKVKEWKH
jgi:hypothetical protein